MSALLLLIPIALALGLCGLAAFLWAAQTGQFDDLDGAALRILEDPDAPAAPPANDDPAAPGSAPERTVRAAVRPASATHH